MFEKVGKAATLVAAGMGICLSSAALARGVGSTGGGAAVVCRDPESAKVERAELLDLYADAQLVLKRPLGSLEREYQRYVAEIRRISDDPRPVGEAEVERLRRFLSAQVRFTPTGVHLESTQDWGRIPVLPERCKVEQLAVYHDDDNQVDIDSEIWSRLDPQNQAALIAHEELYRIYRLAGDRTSEIVRNLVRRLFSANPLGRVKEGVPQGAALFGSNLRRADLAATMFYAYEAEGLAPSTTLQFTQLFGRLTLSPVRAMLPFQIKRELLRAQPIRDEYVIVVMDPEARYHVTVPLEGGIFEGYRIEVRYEYRQPFSVALIDREGSLLDFELVNFIF